MDDHLLKFLRDFLAGTIHEFLFFFSSSCFESGVSMYALYRSLGSLHFFVYCSFLLALFSRIFQVTIAVEPSDSVISLKRQLASALGHAPETQKLFFAPSDGPRRQLQNGRPLSFYLGANTTATHAKLQLVVSSTSHSRSPRADHNSSSNSSGNAQWASTSNSELRERQPSSSNELITSTSVLPGGFDNNNNNSPPRSRSDSALNGSNNGNSSRPTPSGRRTVASKRVSSSGSAGQSGGVNPDGGAPAEAIDDQSICSTQLSSEHDLDVRHNSISEFDDEDAYDIDGDDVDEDDENSSFSSDYDNNDWTQRPHEQNWWVHSQAAANASTALALPSAAVFRRRSRLGDGDDSLGAHIAAHVNHRPSSPRILSPRSRKCGHNRNCTKEAKKSARWLTEVGAAVSFTPSTDDADSLEFTHEEANTSMDPFYGANHSDSYTKEAKKSARWLTEVGAAVSFTPSNDDANSLGFMHEEANTSMDPFYGANHSDSTVLPLARSRKASKKKSRKSGASAPKKDEGRGGFVVIGGAPSGPQNDGSDESSRSSEGDYDDDDYDTQSYSNHSDVSQSVSVMDAQRERALKHATPVSKIAADPMLLAKTKRVHDIVDSLRPDQLQVLYFCSKCM